MIISSSCGLESRSRLAFFGVHQQINLLETTLNRKDVSNRFQMKWLELELKLYNRTMLTDKTWFLLYCNNPSGQERHQPLLGVGPGQRQQFEGGTLNLDLQTWS